MIISVASGKGGTGKTLCATSMALTLKDEKRVQLLDCDVEEPNDHIFLKPDFTQMEAVKIAIPEVNKEKCNSCGVCATVCNYHALVVFPEEILVFPHLCHGCGACTYLCPEKAIVELGREIGVIESGMAAGIHCVQGLLNIGETMAPFVIRKVKGLITNDSIAIIDAPPGTSCPVIEAIKGSDFCLLVTEPTPFGLNDLALAMETVKILKIPCGVIINRAGIGDNNRVQDYCHKENIPVLLSIPFNAEIARNYSRGITLVEGLSQWKKSFIQLFQRIQEIVSERNRCYQR
jgi:MinD superfamily P-loop ATPase